MAKARRVYVCQECGSEFPRWTGRCLSCQAWASVGEMARPAGAASRSVGARVEALAAVDCDIALPFPVGIDEVDRVLGGGLTPGSVTLLAGEPGVGKSTLTLQVAMAVASAGAAVLLVAGEEAPSQVAARAARLGSVPPSLLVIDDVGTEVVVAALEERRPQLLIVDSIQTLRHPDVDGPPGSVAQVKAAAGRLVDAAKWLGVSTLLVGHVTKEGAIAGPRLLEHVVDTVLQFDGEQHGELRFLRTLKHRFGPTNDVGIFDMTGQGLTPVPDPSDRYLRDRRPGLAGSVVVPALSGRRPVLVELQALAVETSGRPGHTTVQGVDGRRAAMVSAVLTSRAGYRVLDHDLFISAAGGAVVAEPAADVTVALAVASAIDGQPVAPDVVALGEIGLGGELRSIPQLEHRLQEAYRMGFRTAVVPASAPHGPTGLRLVRAATVDAALAAVPHGVSA